MKFADAIAGATSGDLTVQLTGSKGSYVFGTDQNGAKRAFYRKNLASYGEKHKIAADAESITIKEGEHFETGPENLVTGLRVNDATASKDLVEGLK